MTEISKKMMPVAKDVQRIAKYIQGMGQNISVRASPNQGALPQIQVCQKIYASTLWLRVGDCQVSRQRMPHFFILPRSLPHLHSNPLLQYTGDVEFLKQYMVMPQHNGQAVMASTYTFEKFTRDQALYLWRILHGF